MPAKLPVKERIIRTATRLFYLQGLNETGINQIIEESHVAKASFYQYFPSKMDLVLTCLDEYYHTLSAVLKRFAGNSKNLEDFFTKWCRLLKKNATTRQSFMGCPIANIGFQVDPGNTEIKEKFNEIIDGWYRILEPLFQKARNDGQIAPEKDLKELFVDVFAINEGALLIWRLTGKREYLDSIQSSIFKVLNN